MNPNQILERGGGVLWSGVRVGGRLGRWAAGGAWGIVQEARHMGSKPKAGMDDVTLARKVETEIFRGRGAPKSTVNVNVVDGVVWLRGEVKRPQQIRSLEDKARSVPEVQGVENLLHLQKTPAATRADTPRRAQRTRSSTRRPQPRTKERGKVSDDHAAALSPHAEPSPIEHARRNEGRTPAPLGATGSGGAAGSGEQQAGALGGESETPGQRGTSSAGELQSGGAGNGGEQRAQSLSPEEATN
jgi:hypothetical protein